MENTAEGETAQIDEGRGEQAEADADDYEKKIGHDGCIDFFQHWDKLLSFDTLIITQMGALVKRVLKICAK